MKGLIPIAFAVCVLIGCNSDRNDSVAKQTPPSKVEEPKQLAAASPDGPKITQAKQPDGPKPLFSDVLVDVSSPDNAVKSWWRVFDERQRFYNRQCLEGLEKSVPYFALVERVAQADVLNSARDRECREEKFDRDLQEVKTESETRAIVFARIRNVSPIPAGAVITKYESDRRIEGERFRYVVEKTGGVWKVSQVYRYDRYDRKEPWTKVYTNTHNVPTLVILQ